MTTSPQFKQALINNLERINKLQIDIKQSGTLYGVYLKDYSRNGHLPRPKSSGFMRHFFLQKVF